MARAPGAKLEHVGVAAGAVRPGAATFDSDLERSWGSLPAPLVAAYPHATDVELLESQIRDYASRRGAARSRSRARPPLRLGHVGLGKVRSRNRAELGLLRFGFDSIRRSPPLQCMPAGARATMPNSGMSSTISARHLGAGASPIGRWLRKYPTTGSTSRDRAIRTAQAPPVACIHQPG